MPHNKLLHHHFTCQMCAPGITQDIRDFAYVIVSFYSPYGNSLVTPVDSRSGGMVRKSTSEMYRSQTDWLRTFQQETSTFNRPTLKATPLMSSNLNMSSNLYPLDQPILIILLLKSFVCVCVCACVQLCVCG